MPKIEEDRLAVVGTRLGEAVLDPTAWPDLMEGICKTVGAVGSALLQSDVRTPDIPRTASMVEPLERYFAGGWHKRDLRARGVPLLLRGKAVVTDADVYTREEMHRAPFFHECVYSSGLKWWAGVGFRVASSLWVLAMQRTQGQGPFETHDTRLLATLSDRLTEVATLSKAVGRIALSSSTNALNAVHRPAVAIDRQGFVLEANLLAQKLFGNEIGVRARRLWVRDRLAKSRLDSLVDQLRTMADDAVVRTAPIAVRRERLPPVLVQALPIPGAARSPFLGARILLTLSDLLSKPRPDPAVLREVFGLTPVESRVAAIISTGTSPEQVAGEIGISFETVRNHLKAIRTGKVSWWLSWRPSKNFDPRTIRQNIAGAVSVLRLSVFSCLGWTFGSRLSRRANSEIPILRISRRINFSELVCFGQLQILGSRAVVCCDLRKRATLLGPAQKTRERHPGTTR
jgi:DNA-binding CsgD family transcriptional regulator